MYWVHQAKILYILGLGWKTCPYTLTYVKSNIKKYIKKKANNNSFYKNSRAFVFSKKRKSIWIIVSYYLSMLYVVYLSVLSYYFLQVTIIFKWNLWCLCVKTYFIYLIHFVCASAQSVCFPKEIKKKKWWLMQRKLRSFNKERELSRDKKGNCQAAKSEWQTLILINDKNLFAWV